MHDCGHGLGAMSLCALNAISVEVSLLCCIFKENAVPGGRHPWSKIWQNFAVKE